MKKWVIGFALLGLAGLMVVLPFFMAMLAVLGGAAAQAAQNPCISPIGVVMPAGGPVRLPTTGQFQVTSPYGMRTSPATGEYRLHAGVDLAQVPTSGPVVAAMAGVVSAIPTTASGGNKVHVDHGGGLETRYLHLSSRTVKVGDRVWAGRQVGVEGNTGQSSGAHLHFEVRQNNVPVDPREWLTEQGVQLPASGTQGQAPPPVTTNPGADDSDLGAGGELLLPDPYELDPPGEPGSTQPVASVLPAAVGPYKGEQVKNAALVIKAGQTQGLDAKTITIAVMTAMGESTLVNVGYGDQAGPDSRGLFQQRANGAWGSLADRMNPTTAATNFYRALVAVPGYLTLEPTIAAHRAQINQDPYHYTPYWADAVVMVSTLTEDPSLLESMPVTGPVDGCADGGPAAPPPAGDGTGADIVAAAQHYSGTPYSWGGGDINGPTLGIYSSPSLDGTTTVGFDCSGIVMFAVYSATGIELPHSAEVQGQDSRGQTIPRDWSQMLPGDVISFSENGSGDPGSFGHVGIYIGNGQMIHASRPGKPLAVVSLKGSDYYEKMAWAIKRYGSK